MGNQVEQKYDFSNIEPYKQQKLVITTLMGGDIGAYDKNKLVDDEIQIIVQVNGKLRDKLVVAINTDDEEIKQLAQKCENVKNNLVGLTVRKVIYVPGKLVNIVAN